MPKDQMQFTDSLKEKFTSSIFGQTGFEYHEEIGSTNDRARQLAMAGAPHGTLIVAGMQTKGRGRYGRSWHSPSGVNIYASLILRPDFSADQWSLLTPAAGLAAAEAVHDVAGLWPGLKWPNDLQIDGKKIAGILAEAETDPDGSIFVILGVGINVNLEQKDITSDLAQKVGSIKIAVGRLVDRFELLAQLIFRIEKRYEDLVAGRQELILESYKLRSITIGREITVSDRAETWSGRALGMDIQGRLCVKRRSTGQIVYLNSGEVSLSGALPDRSSR